jgi:methyltransferase-like protein
MIMLARVVPYGGNAVRYALEKEKAKMVKVNHMPEGIDPTAIWYMMKHHCQLHQQDRTVGRKLERFMAQFVISPSKEEAANFTMNDWANLGDETLETLDAVGLIPKGMEKEVKTNFRNSMNVSGLHSDSKSGTLHLHLDCCRVDLEGNTNDVHNIHIRAMMAAEIINMRHGWKQPKEIRDMRKAEIADFCEYTLQKMQEFDVDFYFKMLRMKGYEVTPRYDKSKKLVGYSIGKNASVFKASEVGRRYMATQLEATWKKLHPQPAQVKVKPATPTVSSSSRPVRPSSQTTISTQPKVQPKPMLSFTTFNINTPNGTTAVEIPYSIKDIFFNEAQIPEDNDTATIENVAHVAMLLFVGYIDAATSMSESCGGSGGSAPESGWGKKDNEDERMFARRCLQMAHSICKPKPRQRGYHR